MVGQFIWFQIAKYHKQFLEEVYPGAKKSPAEMVNMLASPEIDPSVKLAGDYNK